MPFCKSVYYSIIVKYETPATIGDFIAKKMKTRDINVMPSFNGFTVVNTAANNSCMFAAIGHQLSVGTGTVSTPAKEIRQDARLYLQLN